MKELKNLKMAVAGTGYVFFFHLNASFPNIIR